MDIERIKRGLLPLLGVVLLAPAIASAQPYDVTWTFGNVGNLAYRLNAVDPPDDAFPPIGTENPTLPLTLGKRYQVVITNPGAHPFEVLSKGASSGQDQVLLSMAVSGSFESDPAVAWQDNGQGTASFTLTLGLYEAMQAGGRTPGYRCRPHAATMRGDFEVTGLPIAELIPPSSVRVDLQPVASGLAAPLGLLGDPVQSSRLYVVDQVGLLRIIDSGQLLSEPLLDVTGLLVPLRAGYDERGLLGVAFHPAFADPGQPGYGLFFTYTSEPIDGPADFTVELPPGATMDHQSVVRQWQWGGGETIDPSSSREILRVDQPQRNHNGGYIEFGPDGYLYIAFGDGGGADDTAAGHGIIGNGQNINTVLGTILRIDPLDPVDTPDSGDAVSANGSYRIPADNPFVGVDGIDEIYAFGLRNPYRFSFDTLSGALIVPDVGQNRVEEINFLHKGRNYGWNLKEGRFEFIPETGEVGEPLDDPSLSDPVVEYDHDDGTAVVAGYTSYGPAAPEFWGRYVFGDFSRAFSSPDGRLFVADLFTGEVEELLIGRTGAPLDLFVKGFGQDHAGDVYLLASTALGPSGSTGVVYKIASIPTEITAVLSGMAAGTGSTGSGLATIGPGRNSTTLSYELKVQGLENVTQAHIHIADVAGGSGPPALWLYPRNPPAAVIAGEFVGVLATGSFTASDFIGPLAGGSLDDLIAAIEEGRAYVNVHTEQFPGGEIRGQLY